MLRWFIENRVASNLLMIAIILGGVLSMPLLEREVMPGIPLDMIQIDVDTLAPVRPRSKSVSVYASKKPYMTLRASSRSPPKPWLGGVV